MTIHDQDLETIATRAARSGPPEDYSPTLLDNKHFTKATPEAREAARQAVWNFDAAWQSPFQDGPDGFRRFAVIPAGELAFLAGEAEDGQMLMGVARGMHPDMTVDAQLREDLASCLRKASDPEQREPVSTDGGLSVSDEVWLHRPSSSANRQTSKHLAALVDQAADLPYSIAQETSLSRFSVEHVSGLRKTIIRDLIAGHGDPEIHRLIDEGSLPKTLRAIEWACLPPTTLETASGPKKVSPNRTALEQVPWFGAMVASMYSGPDGTPVAIELTERLYEGTSPLALSAEFCGMSSALAKRLRPAKLHDLAQSPEELSCRIDDLKMLPDPRQLRIDRKCIDDAIEVVTANEIFAEITGYADDLKGCGGRFDLLLKAGMGEPARGMRDLDEYLRDKITLPSLWHVAKEAGLGDDDACHRARTLAEGHKPLAGFTLSQALKANASWHNRLTGLNARINTGDSIASWSPFQGDVELGAGIIAHELCSGTELKVEGISQDHCVSGYKTKVMRGECLVYSLRRGDDVLSTVEISDGEGSLHGDLQIQQNYGHSNENPGDEAEAAGEALLEHLKKIPRERIHDYELGLNRAREALPDETSLAYAREEIAGYDFTDISKVETAFSELKQFLPKPARTMDPASWIKATHPELSRSAGQFRQDQRQEQRLQ